MSSKSKDLIPEKRILKIIMVIRGENVILDSDLAKLYDVETRRLNEQVRRNIEKFPDDFMFQLTKEEFKNLKSQISSYFFNDFFIFVYRNIRTGRCLRSEFTTVRLICRHSALTC